jgi:DNA-binding protein H-NS
MEKLRKKNETEIQNTVEGHSCRAEQTEDRISELEDEITIKGKIEKLLVNNSRPVKRKYKNSWIPSKYQNENHGH